MFSEQKALPKESGELDPNFLISTFKLSFYVSSSHCPYVPLCPALQTVGHEWPS